MDESVELAITERLQRVQAQIASACKDAGRSVDEVTLVGVSKTRPPEQIIPAVKAGLRNLGENRPEEADQKMGVVNAACSDAPPIWHMIGHIQSRKARLIDARYGLIHSLDNLKLATKFSRMAVEQDFTVNALLEINVSGEASKGGLSAMCWQDDAAVRKTLWDEVAQIVALDGVQIHGLMTIAPIAEDLEQVRPTFHALRELRDALAGAFPAADWTQLSMGMSDDFPVAIQEGATIVRIGRAIFGRRV